MGLWKDKIRGDWRYSFEHKKKTYAGGGHKTKAAARTAREQRRKEVKRDQEIKTVTVFSDVSNPYLDWSKRRHVKKTYEYKAMVFREFIAFHGDIPIDAITPEIIHEYLDSRPSNHNYNVHRKELNALFNHSRQHMCTNVNNPCVSIEKMPINKKRRDIPTTEEFLKIMAASNYRTRSLLVVLVYTLARVDEILRLTWQDINFESRTLALHSRKNRAGEWKERIIGMNNDLYSLMKVMWDKRRQEQWVFWNARTKDRFNRRPKLMKFTCERAGVPHYGLHAIRHFVATYAHDIQKVTTGVLSGILGHESKRTTEIYLHSVDEAQRQAVTTLEGLIPENMLAADACGFGGKGRKKAVKDRTKTPQNKALHIVKP